MSQDQIPLVTSSGKLLGVPLARRMRKSPARLLSTLQSRLAQTDVTPFRLQLHDGSVHHLSGRSAASPMFGRAAKGFTLTVLNDRGARALDSLDELRIGEAYVSGALDVDGDFLHCLDLRQIFRNRHPLRSLLRFLGPFALGQRRSDFAWVPRHYDFGNEFYFAFLDRWVGLYSQALYKADDESLEQAVRNKLDYIVDACRLRRGAEVLDVGGGWGALEKFIGAKGINSTMLTLSREQFDYLSAWTARHDLPCQLKVVRESIFSYRPSQHYDAIVLLGVMEHLPDYPRLFAQFERLLKPGGRLYMDFAAGQKKYNVSAFTYRYVFPGNHTPVYLPDLFVAANRFGFEPIALHNDRHSYYRTLEAWARNLEAARQSVIPRVGEQVYRLFRLYLWGGAHQLERDGSLESYRIVFQRSRGRPSSEIGCHRPL
ncbi:MAG: class I SAM-dependent methyltransferase [Acidobacteria bacterium]|nr:class I SAM-dependent methyltransferase [Acidobacteriota bacterium]